MWEASSQVRLGSHTKGCISMKSAPEEKVAAQSFISSFPHFVRIMKKFNVSGSFTLVSVLLLFHWNVACCLSHSSQKIPVGF